MWTGSQAGVTTGARPCAGDSVKVSRVARAGMREDGESWVLGMGWGAEASSPGGPLPMERHPAFNPVMGAATGMAESRSPVCPGTCLSAVWPQQAGTRGL